ncbi:MAG: hypothetical protein ABI878_01970 [Acidobacteriota bacterium]
MKINETDLKDAFKKRAGARPDCVSSNDIKDLVSGSLSLEQRRVAEDHLALCNSCAEDYRSLVSLKEWAVKEALKHGWEEPKVTWVEQWHSILSLRFVVAAAIVLTAVIAIPFFVLRNQLDGRSGRNAQRGSSSVYLVTDPLDDSLLDAPPEKLSWEPSAGSFGYKVSLFDRESTLIWESDLTKVSSVSLTADVRSHLEAGQVYYWRITIFDGAPRQSSLLKFRIREDVDRPR